MPKICTSIEQSKKLIELGLDRKTSDMYYWCGSDLRIGGYKAQDEEGDIPAWSLSALLDILDDIMVDDEGNEYSLTIYKEEGLYYINYHDRWGAVDDIETDCYYDLVDACVAMIELLHEQKLL